MVSKEADGLFYKFIEQVESIFKNLPKPLKWQSFLNNDLILLTDILFHPLSKIFGRKVTFTQLFKSQYPFYGAGNKIHSMQT